MKSGPLTQTALADRTGYLRVVSPPPPSLCSTAYQAPLADIELNGAGVGSPVQTPVENCCDACDTEPTCTGFVLFGSTCYLKSGALTQASASGRTGYLHSARIASPPALPPPSSCDANYDAPQYDTELSGQDVGSPTSTPVENCCTACDALGTCKGFVILGGTCYLKGGTLSEVNLAGRIAYVKKGNSVVLALPPSPPPAAVAPPPGGACAVFAAPIADTELGGADVGAQAMPPEDCCAACSGLSTCGGFVVFGAMCYLKGGTLSQIPLAGRTAYILASASPPALPPPSSCPTNYDAPQYDTELSGQDVGSPTSTPVENCCTACDALGTCKGFVILGGTCYLKGGTLSEVNLAGRIAYVKKGNSVVLALPPSPPPTAGSPPPGACTDIFNPPIADTELSGSDVGAQAMPVEQCCAACDQDFACEGFVVFGPTCYLKGGGVSQIPLAGRTAYIHATRVSAPPPPSPPPSSCSVHFGAPLVDHDLSGSGVGSPTQIPVENCCIACDADTACIGFVVFGSEGRGHRTRATPDHHAHLVCHGPVVCGPLGVTLP